MADLLDVAFGRDDLCHLADVRHRGLRHRGVVDENSGHHGDLGPAPRHGDIPAIRRGKLDAPLGGCARGNGGRPASVIGARRRCGHRAWRPAPNRAGRGRQPARGSSSECGTRSWRRWRSNGRTPARRGPRTRCCACVLRCTPLTPGCATNGTTAGRALPRRPTARPGRGGQILVSRTVHDLIADDPAEQIRLVDRGSDRLRDLSRPEQVFELRHPDLPEVKGALRSLAVVRTTCRARCSASLRPGR